MWERVEGDEVSKLSGSQIIKSLTGHKKRMDVRQIVNGKCFKNFKQCSGRSNLF